MRIWRIARQAVLGDAIARLLEARGAEVTREHYFNDRGVITSYSIHYTKLYEHNFV